MEEYTQLRYLPVASATLASGKEVREVRRSTKVQKSRRILRPWNEVAFFDLEESAEHPPAKDDRERKNGALIGVVKPQESLSRAMAHIGFVSTSVLESKDGIDFNEEVRKQSEEVKEAERIAIEADKKPLWEQLAGKRDEKQAKFDAVRASMFAPPRALDDEESNFLQGVEAQRLEARDRKQKWEAEELRGFALARANQTVAIAEPKKPKPKPKPIADTSRGDIEPQEAGTGAPPPVVAVKIKAKRKKDKGRDRDEKRAKRKSDASGDRLPSGDTKDKGKDAGGADPAPSVPLQKGKGKASLEGGDGGKARQDYDDPSGGTGLVSLLGAYDSDDSASGGDA